MNPEETVMWYQNPILIKAGIALIGILLIYIISKIVQRLLIGKIKDNSSRYRFRKGIGFIGFFVQLLLLSIVFSDKLGGLTVAIGVAGAGIAFALQEVIVSVAGWIAVSFGNFYSTGDRIQLGGIKGDVIDIGVLRTTLMEIGNWVNGDNYTGRVVRVANSFVFKEPVHNYSGDFPFLWDEIIVPVRFGSDVQYTKDTLLKIANEIVGNFVVEAGKAWKKMTAKYMIENASVDPMVTLIANDNWMEFTLRYPVDYRKRKFTKDLLFTRVIEEVNLSDNKIMLASATYEIVAMPQINVTDKK
ncbi:mechanosensitive ion channel family protein [Bacteroidota bacterium]